MEDKLENIRMLLPIEVTTVFFAIIQIYKENDIGPSEGAGTMSLIVAFLLAVNAYIYFRTRNLRSISWHLFLAIGFLIWVVNIDLPRYLDTPYLADYIQVGAPVILALYTLLCSILPIPKGDSA